jgi:hypothetical protein
MFEERSKQGLLAACVAQRVGYGAVQGKNIAGDEVGQVGVLGSIPYLLIRIKFRSISWQPFKLQSFGKTLKRSACSAAVYRVTVDEYLLTSDRRK